MAWVLYQHQHMEHQHSSSTTHNNHYVHLGIMAALSFAAMYVLMYAMVDSFANVYNNVNQLYMAAVMTAPMVIIELVVMRAMYRNKRLNVIVMVTALVVGVLSFVGIRQQVAVGDTQFLRSMIPHHAGAILMCGQAPIADPEISGLCRRIIVSQQQEIDLMKRLLARVQ
jgi:uncharacterized protein (DUF305 family)